MYEKLKTNIFEWWRVARIRNFIDNFIDLKFEGISDSNGTNIAPNIAGKPNKWAKNWRKTIKLHGQISRKRILAKFERDREETLASILPIYSQFRNII